MLATEPGTIVLAILLGSLVLFLTDALRYDLIALVVVLALVLTRCLPPEEAFAGFASEPVVVIACLSLFGAALARHGIADALCSRIVGVPGGGEAWLVLRLSLVAALLAAFLSDVAVIAVLIPVAGSIARERGIPVSRLLLPVSYGCLLGDLLIVVGSAKSIAVNGVLAARGVEPFAMFEFTHFGLLLLAVGLVYVAGPMRRLVRGAPAPERLEERYHVPRQLAEVLVEPSNALVHRSVADVPEFEAAGVTVVGIVRAGSEGAILAPGPTNRIRPGDTLVLQGEPEALSQLREQLGLRERAAAGGGGTRLVSDEVLLVEAVLPPGSDLVGRTLHKAGFRTHTNLNVLAVAHHGEVVEGRPSELRLVAGDTLLLQGHVRDLKRAASEAQVVILSDLGRVAGGRAAWTSVALLAGSLALAVSGLLPLHVATLAGALLLVLTGCLPARRIYREIDWTVLVLVGGMLALGRAFDRYGLADGLAAWLAGIGPGEIGPRGLILLLVVATTLLSQVTTSIATAVILTPVALSLAAHMGVSERPFVMAVLVGANCAFLSPVAHPANAMIVGPGSYRFRDFVRAGTPLTIVMAGLATWLLPVLWPLRPDG